MIQFLMQHQLWSVAVLSWIYSAAVSAMPDPGANTNPGYTWLYRFLHTIAGNLSTAFSEAARYRAGASPAGRIPGLKVLVFILMVPLLISTPACAAAHYTVHPGALNKVDSAAYDTLLIAETTIDQARLDYKSGQLPTKAKPALDALVESYNIARVSWLTYRGALTTNVPAGEAQARQRAALIGEAQARQRAALIDVYLSQLNQNLTDLTSAIRALEHVK